MPNNVAGALGDKYIPTLDTVYQNEAKSRVLDAVEGDFEFSGVDTVKLRKMSMDGLGNIDRNGDLTQGEVIVETETFKLEQDRGTSFKVDPMDNEETQGIAFGRLGGEFLRTRVIPEMDAYRFSKLAGYAGNTVEADLTAETVDTAMATAVLALENEEVPDTSRVFFCSPDVVFLLEQLKNFVANVNAEMPGNIGKVVGSYKGIPIVKVPKKRFYTAITLFDGTTQFGYEKTAVTGKDINFILVHAPSVRGGIIKYNPMEVVRSTSNANSFRDTLKFRMYHDYFVWDNKIPGVYVHHKTT